MEKKYRIEGMHCGSCAFGIEDALKKLKGVKKVNVDFATQDGVVKAPATPHNSGRLSVAVVANHANHILANYYTMGAYFQ